MTKTRCACALLAMLVPMAASAYTLGDAKAPVAPDQPRTKPRVQIIINDAGPVKRQRAKLVYFTQRLDGPGRLDGCMRQTGSRVTRAERPDQRCPNALPGDVFVPMR
jgi:hypothetical protein